MSCFKRKKYRLTRETKVVDGHVLHRVALNRGLAGTGFSRWHLGGFIEGEHNLSQDGAAFVNGGAMVYGDAHVGGDAMVYGHAKVYDNACVSGHARVGDFAVVSGFTNVEGDAIVYGRAKVYDYSVIRENARVGGSAVARGHSSIAGDAMVYGFAVVDDGSCVLSRAAVFENAKITGNATINGNASVHGNANVVSALVGDSATICGDAYVRSGKDFIVLRDTWSSGRYFTCFRTESGRVMWSAGRFYGTGDELVEMAYRDSEKSGKCYKAAVKYANAVFDANRQDLS